MHIYIYEIHFWLFRYLQKDLSLIFCLIYLIRNCLCDAGRYFHNLWSTIIILFRVQSITQHCTLWRMVDGKLNVSLAGVYSLSLSYILCFYVNNRDLLSTIFRLVFWANVNYAISCKNLRLAYIGANIVYPRQPYMIDLTSELTGVWGNFLSKIHVSTIVCSKLIMVEYDTKRTWLIGDKLSISGVIANWNI